MRFLTSENSPAATCPIESPKVRAKAERNSGALSTSSGTLKVTNPRREKASATPAVAFDTGIDAERAKGRPPKGFAKLNGAKFVPADSYCDLDFEDEDKMEERIAITYAYDGKFWDHQLIVLQVVTENLMRRALSATPPSCI